MFTSIVLCLIFYIIFTYNNQAADGRGERRSGSWGGENFPPSPSLPSPATTSVTCLVRLLPSLNKWPSLCCQIKCQAKEKKDVFRSVMAVETKRRVWI